MREGFLEMCNGFRYKSTILLDCIVGGLEACRSAPPKPPHVPTRAY